MILEFVTSAMTEVRNGASISRFMDLRYNLMSQKCPHGTFSVEQASLDFFEQAYRHIVGIDQLPTDTSKRQLSEYDKNYISWIKEAQKENKL